MDKYGFIQLHSLIKIHKKTGRRAVKGLRIFLVDFGMFFLKTFYHVVSSFTRES
jgi:hypothetical protein